MSATPQQRDFFEFVKAIGESKSKQEEDRIISDEVIFLKKVVPQPGTNKKKMKEMVIRALYVEMLGQDASFAYIKAVELCASTSIAQKRVGYLAAALCLSPEHEFRFMLINQIQRDMKSSNQLEICAALIAICSIVTEDMIPAVLGDVLKLLKHEMEVVRKRAVCALHRLYQMDPTSITDHIDKVRRALCDKDPSVMGSTLPLFYSMIQDDVAQFKDLVPSFVSILKQITEHRLPRDYDYHRIPSPWIQMNLLRILALLGRGDQSASEGMYEVLVDVMKRADTGINVGYAIVYETVCTVTTIYPNALLLDAAATSISRFIRSDSHNLKYIGIKGLASIVKDHPRYAADHQMAVIDCLEDPDETLKRKTLDLLFRMTNAVNVEFIVEKLLASLASAVDDHFRTDLVGQITQCAERFAPSNAWYVQIVIRVFELAGEKVKPSVAQTLTQLIAEGTDEDDNDDDDVENKDDELRTEAVENFMDLIHKPKLPGTLAQAMAWVLGEYGYLATSFSKEDIMEELCDLLQRSLESDTKAQIITALMKLVAQNGVCPPQVSELVEKLSHSIELDIQQRCLEFKVLLNHSHVMADVLPVDASCEDLEVDDHLSFLDSYVQMALNSGAQPYTPPQNYDEDDDHDDAKNKGFNITPYAAPAMPVAPSSGVIPSLAPGAAIPGAPGAMPAAPAAAPHGLVGASNAPLPVAPTQGNQLLNARGMNQVWGRKPEPAPAPTPPPVAPTPMSTPVAPVTPVNTYNTPQQSTPPEQVAPAVMSEKEKMAAALFGGLGGGASKPTSSRRTSSRGQKNNLQTLSPASSVNSAATVEPPANQMPAAVAPAPTPVHTAPPAANNFMTDLLDLDMSAPMPATTLPPSTAVVPPAAPLDAMSLMGMDMGMNSPAAGLATTTPMPLQPLPAVQPSPTLSPTPSMSQMSISDAFSDIMLSPTGMPGASGPVLDPGVKPLPISTVEFGKRWGSTPCEVRKMGVKAGMGVRGLPEVRAAMPGTYHHVESIGQTQEAIYAAVVTAVGAAILAHVKFTPARKTVDVVVKASSHDVGNRELEVICAAISGFQ